MSRRRSHKQDRLELLLDAICNTFGGVLFIAILEPVSKPTRCVSEGDSTLDIPTPSLTLRVTFHVLKPHLVVMLLQQTGGAPAIRAPASPVELQSLASHLGSVVSDLERLRQNRDSQQKVAQNFAPEAIRELLARRREVTATSRDVAGACRWPVHREHDAGRSGREPVRRE